MGNCSTTPHKNQTAESPDLKYKDGTTTKKKLWLSPYLEEEIGSDTNSGGGSELSPIILTPPMRSRMISAEIFESTNPPQSEERTIVAVRNIDKLDVAVSRPLIVADTLAVQDEKVSSVSSEVVVESAYTSTVDNRNLSESSLITCLCLNVDKVDTECDESATNEVRIENQNHQVVQNRQVVSREHRHLARIALVVLSCFYLLCLACLGWTGTKVINSAKVLLLPPPKMIAHSFGKFV